MKILYKILLPVILAASTGLFVTTLYTYEMSIDTLKTTSSSLQKMATANALVELKAGLDFNILNAISLAQTGILQPYLSGDPEMQMAYASDTRSRIINMRNTYYYVMLGVLSPSGRVLDHTEDRFIGTSFADEPFFKEAMQGNVAIGAPYKYEGMVVYAVASPVYHLDTNQIIGVVFNVSKLTDTMSERMLLGDRGYLFVSDRKGTVFIHRDSSQVFTKNLFDYDWGREILERGQGEITFEIDGERKIAQYDVLPDADWVAVAVHDLDELAAPGEAIRRNATVIAMVILMVLAAIIYLYVKNIVDALLKAVQYAEQVAMGVLDKDLDFGHAEQSGFQRMSVGINRFFDRLRGKDYKAVSAEKIYNLDQFSRNDELGVLYQALQVMVHSMRAMVKKADDSNRMKSEFLANMSHEIRTPLNAVIGLAHLCLESTEGDEKKRDYVMKIEVAGKSLLGIINNVLDTSKIEAGMLELEEVQFSLRDLGEQISTIYQESATSKNLQLVFTIEEDLIRGGHYDSFIGDPIRLGQILNNLVGNAIKFTEEGRVSVTCSLAEELMETSTATMQDLDEANGCAGSGVQRKLIPLCIEVSDTGIGFSKEQEAVLFQPFAQADTSITRRFGGTGLGLVISKHLVELMGGSMHVHSEVGIGTTFTILLFLPQADRPLDSSEASASGEETSGAFTLNLAGKHVLVVEDNMINQLIMEELLEKTQAKVSMADNGQIAVDMVAKEQFDLILMDMQMPVMDGIQATGIIRQSHDASELPIIAVTANAMKEDKERGIAMGLNDYLTKPIDPKNLMRVLDHWMHHSA